MIWDMQWQLARLSYILTICPPLTNQNDKDNLPRRISIMQSNQSCTCLSQASIEHGMSTKKRETAAKCAAIGKLFCDASLTTIWWKGCPFQSKNNPEFYFLSYRCLKEKCLLIRILSLLMYIQPGLFIVRLSMRDRLLVLKVAFQKKKILLNQLF